METILTGREPSSGRCRYASARATPATKVPWQVKAFRVLPGAGAGSAASRPSTRNWTAAGPWNHGRERSTPLSSTAMTTGSGLSGANGGSEGEGAVLGRGGVALNPMGRGAVRKAWSGVVV